MHEAGKLADFGAALTTADAGALQEVLGTLNVVERIEKTLLLLKKELELSKLQATAPAVATSTPSSSPPPPPPPPP